MKKIDKFIRNQRAFYNGDVRKISEIGGILVKRMIELDLRNTKAFPPFAEPYEWIARKLDKHERTVRRWTCDWEGRGGSKPTFSDFMNIMYITKSRRPIEFFESLIADATPQELAKNHGNTMKKVIHNLKELTEKLESLL